MASKKTPPSVFARVRVLRSFNGFRAGDEADTVVDQMIRGWIDAGLMKVVGDGTDPAGPGGAEPDDHERVPDGAAGSLEASREPGESFGAGGYGTSAQLDQG